MHHSEYGYVATMIVFTTPYRDLVGGLPASIGPSKSKAAGPSKPRTAQTTKTILSVASSVRPSVESIV
jgi:hypothetical protein